MLPKTVTLTFPRHLMTESGSLTASVTATPKGGFPRTIEQLTVDVVAVRGVSLRSLDCLSKTTTMTDTEDISCILWGFVGTAYFHHLSCAKWFRYPLQTTQFSPIQNVLREV